MGKTTALFRKIRDTKGIFHTEMGTIKDRNVMDLTEAEDIICALQRFGQDLGQQVDRLERGEEREQRGGRTDDGEDRKQDHALLGREAS